MDSYYIVYIHISEDEEKTISVAEWIALFYLRSHWHMSEALLTPSSGI